MNGGNRVAEFQRPLSGSEFRKVMVSSVPNADSDIRNRCGRFRIENLPFEI